MHQELLQSSLTLDRSYFVSRSMDERSTHHTRFILVMFVVAFLFIVGIAGPDHPVLGTHNTAVLPSLAPAVVAPPLSENIDSHATPPGAHIATPAEVRGVYTTGWNAGTTRGLRHILELFDGTVLNSVVLDIKDATGKLSYQPLDPELRAIGVGTNRIKNLSSVIDEFHTRGIYVIGRLTVFEDPFFASLYPSETYTDTRTGLPWKNFKGLTWLRANSDLARAHIVAIARDAYAQGFDEINVDYVRFPSDGDLKALDLSSFTKNKQETIHDFFLALDTALDGIPFSADVFGLTMSANDDVGIGQKAVLIAPSVDALAPMIYPSHFWNGTYGIPVPAREPYTVIHRSLSDGIAKLAAVGITKDKLRPWLQDFDLLGVPYGTSEVRAQIDATEDLGITSWLMWDPRNIYHKDAFVNNYVEPEVKPKP